jgi:hypothetical protein
MGIRDKPIAPGSPWQNGFAERLIGSIRRECVDHIVVLGEAHFRRILTKYAAVSWQRRSDLSRYPARRPHHIQAGPSRLLKKGRLPLTLNCESDSYANKGMAGGIDARFGCADG